MEEELKRKAILARNAAYAPYSKFKVGAALLTKDGNVVIGCNVENISFGLTMCAERVAVGAAIGLGAHEFTAIAIASDSSEPVVPCGACRQVLAEFAPRLKIVSTTVSGKSATFSLAELLPKPRQGILE